MILANLTKIIKNIVNRIPIFIKVPLVIFLTLVAWNYKTINYGVSKGDLKSVSGTLYSVQCNEKITGSDSIYLKTSLSKENIVFSGYQRCQAALRVKVLYDLPLDVIYEVKEVHNFFNGTPSYMIYGIKHNGDFILQPVNGVGEYDMFNPYILPILLLVYWLLESIFKFFRRLK